MIKGEKLITTNRMMILALLLLFSFIPVALPDAIGEGYIAVVSIFALLLICFFATLAKRNYNDKEFNDVASAFLAFGALFAISKLLGTMISNDGGNVTRYLLDGIWIAGYILPLFACWRAMLKYGEYLDIKFVFRTIIVAYVVSLMVLIPLGASTIASNAYPNILDKILDILFPFLDTVLLTAIVLLAAIYWKGKLENYWDSIALGIFVFTVADLSSALANAYDIAGFQMVFSGLYILSYFLIAVSFASIAYTSRKESMQPLGQYDIQQAFFINDSGLLFAYASQEESKVDKDILSGMLSAVQNFVKDSFDESEDTTEVLEGLRYGRLEINIEHGKYSYLALVLRGKGTEHLHSGMREFIADIENRFEDVLSDWNGNRDETKSIDAELKRKFIDI